MLACILRDHDAQRRWLHAHDVGGSADASVFRAWCEETDPHALVETTRCSETALAAWDRSHGREGCTCSNELESPCDPCCRMVRAATPCPTWAEVTQP